MDDLTLALVDEKVGLLIEAIEQNTEKLQELLERVECIDNQFDELKESGGFLEKVVEVLHAIHRQGRT